MSKAPKVPAFKKVSFKKKTTPKISNLGLNPAEDGENYERRIVLVGKTGVGKSAVGNTILGKEAFKSELSPSSKTRDCEKDKGLVNDRPVAVIDTPGLFDTHYTKEEVIKRIKMCISLSAPGPHAFLVVLRLGRFTQEENEAMKMIQTTFGKDAAKYTMVLFTHGDSLKTQTIEKFLAKSSELKGIIKACGGRYHVFNNEIEDSSQVSLLIDMIDKMTKKNGGGFYTNEMFIKAGIAIENEKVKLLRESQPKMEAELKVLRQHFEGAELETRENEVRKRYDAMARHRAERANAFIAAPFVFMAAVASGVGLGALTGIAGGPTGALIGALTGAISGVIAGVAGVSAGAALYFSDQCTIQ